MDFVECWPGGPIGRDSSIEYGARLVSLAESVAKCRPRQERFLPRSGQPRCFLGVFAFRLLCCVDEAGRVLVTGVKGAKRHAGSISALS